MYFFQMNCVTTCPAICVCSTYGSAVPATAASTRLKLPFTSSAPMALALTTCNSFGGVSVTITYVWGAEHGTRHDGLQRMWIEQHFLPCRGVLEREFTEVGY